MHSLSPVPSGRLQTFRRKKKVFSFSDCTERSEAPALWFTEPVEKSPNHSACISSRARARHLDLLVASPFYQKQGKLDSAGRVFRGKLLL
mmetsp:Transcript_19149/g.43328  ORF Transcript_19149/g.43328 Transcript_19149/m.43328 type:complete len:90 (+) Transcript_19149:255-524(+)